MIKAFILAHFIDFSILFIKMQEISKNTKMKKLYKTERNLEKRNTSLQQRGA